MTYNEAIEKVMEAYDNAMKDYTYVNRAQAAYNAADNMAFGIALETRGYTVDTNYNKFMAEHGREVIECRCRLLWMAGIN